jgi:sortase A
MRARTRKTFIRIASLVLLAGGLYFLFKGGRELILPWWHQKQAARNYRPAPPQPVPQLQPPKQLDHSLFHRGDTVAQLSIPRLKSMWYVVEGTEDGDLRLGPGHLPGTAFPGEKGNCVIAGHRDTQFRALKDIRKGDEILLTTSIGESRYRVIGYDIVKPTDTGSLQDTTNGVLNLVTCYPFYYVGHAPRRFIVHAELAEPEYNAGNE